MRTIQPDGARLRRAARRVVVPWTRHLGRVLRRGRQGDAAALRDVLARDPNLYRAEYWYTPPIHFAVRAGRIETTQVLLEAGADPAWRAMSGDDLATLARDRGHDTLARLARARVETAAGSCRSRSNRPTTRSSRPRRAAISKRSARASRASRTRLRTQGSRRGLALHAAARAGHRPLVELLLGHGADPNFTIDSSGSATWAASTPELRQLLLDRGGRLDCYDLVFLDEDDEARASREGRPGRGERRLRRRARGRAARCASASW